jgi:2,5-diketo-D-gluconate reductase A
MMSPPPFSDFVTPEGVRIPRVGYGTYPLLDEAARHVYEAIGAGVRLIDTASAYNNHAAVGRGIRQAVEHGVVTRNDLVVVTKVAGADYGEAETRAVLERQEAELGLQVDICLLHEPRWDDPPALLAAWTALLNAQQTIGRPTSVGVSNLRTNDMQFLIDATGVVPAVHQLEIHPKKPQRDVIQLHENHGIITQAWGPLGAGFAVSKAQRKREEPPRLLDDPTVNEIAATHQATPAQVLLAWSFHQGFAAMTHTTRQEHLTQNLSAQALQLQQAELCRLSSLSGFATAGR